MIATSSKSSVFVITHEFFPMRGGIATYVEEMARASVGLGYDVEVWAPHSAQADDRNWPFRVLRVPLRGTQDLSCQVRMARQMIWSTGKASTGAMLACCGSHRYGMSYRFSPDLQFLSTRRAATISDC